MPTDTDRPVLSEAEAASLMPDKDSLDEMRVDTTIKACVSLIESSEGKNTTKMVRTVARSMYAIGRLQGRADQAKLLDLWAFAVGMLRGTLGDDHPVFATDEWKAFAAFVHLPDEKVPLPGPHVNIRSHPKRPRLR